MDFSSHQPLAGQSEVIETNNFRRLLSHFDSDGKLWEPATIFDIECQVCAERHLAFTNSAFGRPADRRYEDYIVLPRCGHAFGTLCLHEWVKNYNQRYRRNTNHSALCPTCRTPIFCDKGHLPVMARFISHDARLQARDIRAIRAQLASPDCVKCLKGGVADRERSELEQRLARDQVTRQSNEFRALLREERQARTRTQDAWSAANTTFDSIRQPLQYATDRAALRNPNFALYGYNNPIEVDFQRVGSNAHSSADDWEGLGARLSNFTPRVREMIDSEGAEAEVARAVNKHLQAIQSLLRQHFSGGPASDVESDAE